MKKIATTKIATTMMMVFAGIAGLILAAECVCAQTMKVSDERFNVDYRKLVSRADFTYDQALPLNEHGVPVRSDGLPSADGIPLGNGRMAGIVRGTPNGIFCQINRPDVVGNNNYTNVPKGQMLAHGCGRLLVDLGHAPFAGQDMRQGLDHYDALSTFTGGGVSIRALFHHELDVLAFELTDNRENPEPITVTLRMLREPKREHRGPDPERGPWSVVSELHAQADGIALTQTFHEPPESGFPDSEHYCRSVMVASVVGRPAQVKRIDDRDIALETVAGKGQFLILIGSAATLDQGQDVTAHAFEQCDVAAEKGFETLLAENQDWWHDFWSKSYIDLGSEDDHVMLPAGRAWTAWLYHMACTNRGTLPPHWNYQLWYPYGDWLMAWGGPRHTGRNLGDYYHGLPAANHLELYRPFFNLYHGALDAAKWHAEHLRGTKDGIFIPETMYWNGPRRYPEDVADEFRRYLLEELKYEDLSDVAKRYAKAAKAVGVAEGNAFEETPACIQADVRPYWYHTHAFDTGARVAFRFWLAYEYNRDKEWLREYAYPMLRGMAEFYRNYPNVKKHDDGKYHIHNVNCSEMLWGGQDTLEELPAMRGMTALAAHASEILGVDEDLRPLWRDIAANTAPLPTTLEDGVAMSTWPHPTLPQRQISQPPNNKALEAWAVSGPPFAAYGAHAAVFGFTPVPHAIYYDVLTLETDDPEAWRLANNSLEMHPSYTKDVFGKENWCGNCTEMTMIAPALGRAEDVKYRFPGQYQGDGVHALKNNLWASIWMERESLTGEGMGTMADGLQRALLASVPPQPGGEPVIRVFPAWPREWDVQFKLAARRGFLVTAAQRNGEIEFVHIESTQGGTCRIRRPWENKEFEIHDVSAGRQALMEYQVDGTKISFDTEEGKQYILTPGD